MEILRKNVRHLRKKSNYTIAQFAAILGLSKNTISAFESGYNTISLSVLIKIRNLFRVTIDDLIFKDITK